MKRALITCAAILSVTHTGLAQKETGTPDQTAEQGSARRSIISAKTRKRFESKSARQRLRAIREVVDKSRRLTALDEIMLRALNDEDARIRLIAVRAIRQFKTPPKTIPQGLIARIDDDPEIAQEAMLAIAQTDTWAEQAREPICAYAKSLQNASIEALELGTVRCFAALDDPRLVPVLARIARRGAADLGITAITGLTQQSATSRASALEDATRSPHAEVRAAAVHAIGTSLSEIPAYRAGLVIALLRDESTTVRQAAGATLLAWSTSDDATTSRMWKEHRLSFAQLEASPVRSLGLWVRAILGTLDKDSVGDAAKHADATVRRLCFVSLKKNDDASLATPLLPLGLSDSDSTVVHAALACARNCGPAAIHATPELVRLLMRSDDRNIRDSAADTIEALGEKAIPGLIASLADPLLRAPVAAVLERFGPTDAILDGLDDENAIRRAAVIEVLGKTVTADDSTVIGLLVSMLSDTSPRVISATVVSLDRQRTAAIPLLRDALIDDDPILRRRAALVLGEMQPYPRCPIAINITALEDTHTPFRILALKRLSGLPQAQAIPHLRKALSDPDVDVQRSAVDSLREFAARELADEHPSNRRPSGSQTPRRPSSSGASSAIEDLVQIVKRAPGPESLPGGPERLALRRQVIEITPVFGSAGLPILQAALALPWPETEGERYHATKLISRAIANLAANEELARKAQSAILALLTRGDCGLREQLAALHLLERLASEESASEELVSEELVTALGSLLDRSYEQLRRTAVGSRSKVRGALQVDFIHQAAALRLLARCAQLTDSPGLALALEKLDHIINSETIAHGSAHATRIRLRKTAETRQDAMKFLASPSIRNVDHLGDLLSVLAEDPTTKPSVVKRATELLGTSYLCEAAVSFLANSDDNDPEVTPQLQKLIKHNNPKIAAAAIRGLSRRGETSALIHIAKDSSDLTLGTIAAAVCDADAGAFIQLLDALDSPKQQNRKIHRVLDVVHAEHPELTLQLLRSSDAERRSDIERRLSRLFGKAPKRTAEILLDYLLDPSTPGQDQIVQAILRLGITPNKAHLTVLEERYRDAKDPAPIARLLLRIGSEAVPTLVALLDSAPEPALAALRDLGPAAEAAIKPLLQFALREGEFLDLTVLVLASIGTRAHTALAQLGVEGPEMVNVLIQVLETSKDNIVLASTARLLQLYRDDAEAAIPVLATLLPKAEQPARAWFALTLANLEPDAPQAAEALLDTLAEPSAELRRHAIRGLSSMDDPLGLHEAMLETLDTDPDPRVRAAAVKGLARLRK